MNPNVTGRLEKLRLSLTEKGLEGILVSQPENRYYLSGFDGSAGYLLITQKDAVLATDFRYYEQVKVQAPDYRLFEVTGGLAEWFPRLASEPGIKTLGFESGDVTHSLYRQLTESISKADVKIQLIPTEGMVESIRAVKEPEEIEFIARAVELTDRAFAHIEETIRPGMTEKEVAWELEKFHRENGSRKLAFDTIVASGPNAALPHWKPSDRKIAEGEPIVIDMGGRIEGYCSDFTRTLCIGKQDDTFKKVYDTVLGAQLAAEELIKAGMSGQEADGFARTVIEEAGYADKFGHSLGHGIGLAEHEQPRVGPNSSDTLLPGMVFSVEPGIYLPGWGGVRIEDLAVLEEDKLTVLTKGRK